MRTPLPVRLSIQAVLAAGAFVMVTPFLYMISTAFMENTFVLPDPPRMIPAAPTFVNFYRVWTSEHLVSYVLNSVLIAACVVAGILFFGSLTAYAFARFNFPAKEIIFRIMLLSMMIPGTSLQIPIFLQMVNFRLNDSRLGLSLIEIALGLAFNTFLMRQFFEGLPRELEEAVLIDGGGHWSIYRHVILPLSQPVLATVTILSFQGAWDEFWWPLVLIKDSSKYTLPIAIRMFQGQHATNYGLVFAASLIALIPIVLIFIFGQKYFIQGLTAGGVKE